ncbi:ATP synthase mitochondrial F1 complex assembly factor 1 isoform X2 [Amia ocellicauda]|uniref:ATP synthase mitochondrial F1 complex assembly factor 1 isoform X2 n=1 Tax=Amia ocellicauda TaxID=2972642 RepID=UPI003463FCA7
MCDAGEGKMAAAVVQMSCLYRGMLAVRHTGIRSLIPGVAPQHLRVFSVRKEPELEANPFYNKYQDKIQALRKAKPQEYNARLEKRTEVKKQAVGHSKQTEFINIMEQQLEKRGKSTSGSGGFTKDKTLESIFNIDKVKDKTGEEIGQIWMQYFANKDTICAVIPGETFETLSSRARSCPTTMGENAPSQLILYHYPELQRDKGIVLMTAELDPKFLDVHQAQCLANQVQLFYGTRRQETFWLVETFNHKPADFRHMAVIAELEQNGLGALVTQEA